VPPSAVLDVFASGRLAGALARSEVEAETFVFDYAAACAAGDAVSLTMPVVRDQYDSMGTVHPIFEMNLPEGALRERLRLAFSKTVSQLDDLGLLAIVGQSQIGRLRYATPGSTPASVPEQNIRELLAYKGSEDLFKDLLQRYAAYSGVSGVQPKVLLRAADALPRVTHRGATHIVKSFDPREYADLAANEFFCMQAARHAGLPAPQMQLSSNRRLLVVERFDLRPDGGYLGCEDFCVLNALRSHGRYEGSYEQIATRIRQFVSPQHVQESLAQLFSMVALSCAVENGDAHLKNFAVIYQDAASPVRLAPVYDIVSTTPYQRRDVLALTLADSKDFPDRKRLRQFGRRACGLSEARVTQLMDAVAQGVKRAITDMRRYAGKRPDFEKTRKHLIAAFGRGMSRSLLEG
jgi:serine/threonine-protein kinase HipA